MLHVTSAESLSQSAAGFSLSLDKLVAAGTSVQCASTPVSTCDVLLCSIGKSVLLTRLNIVRDLWQAGVRCSVLDQQEVSVHIALLCSIDLLESLECIADSSKYST